MHCSMSELSERLKRLQDATGWDQVALAEQLAVTQPTVSRYLAGGKTKSADVFRTLDKLEREHGLADFPAGRIAVMGRVGAGAEIFSDLEQIPPEGLMEIELSIPMPDGCCAYLVEGDSMYPRFNHGDVVVCTERGTDPDIVIGWEAAVETDEGKRYLKKVLKGSHFGVFDLESHNAPTIRDVRLKSVERVYAIFPPHAVRRSIRSLAG